MFAGVGGMLCKSGKPSIVVVVVIIIIVVVVVIVVVTIIIIIIIITVETQITALSNTNNIF